MPHGFIPVENAASIELIYSVNGTICENVIHVEKGSPYSLSDLQAVRGIVDSWDNATWKRNRAPNASLIRIRTRSINAEGDPGEDYYLPSPRGGTAPTYNAQPNNVSFSVKKATGLTGRNNRGRWYCVGISIAMQENPTGNQITAAYANQIVGDLNTLLTNLVAGGHTPVVVSYYHNGWRAAGVTQRIVNFVAVDRNFDSMRRRLTGRGV